MNFVKTPDDNKYTFPMNYWCSVCSLIGSCKGLGVNTFIFSKWVNKKELQYEVLRLEERFYIASGVKDSDFVVKRCKVRELQKHQALNIKSFYCSGFSIPVGYGGAIWKTSRIFTSTSSVIQEWISDLISTKKNVEAAAGFKFCAGAQLEILLIFQQSPWDSVETGAGFVCLCKMHVSLSRHPNFFSPPTNETGLCYSENFRCHHVLSFNQLHTNYLQNQKADKPLIRLFGFFSSLFARRGYREWFTCRN